jgi:hypothetical protein
MDEQPRPWTARQVALLGRLSSLIEVDGHAINTLPVSGTARTAGTAGTAEAQERSLRGLPPGKGPSARSTTPGDLTSRATCEEESRLTVKHAPRTAARRPLRKLGRLPRAHLMVLDRARAVAAGTARVRTTRSTPLRKAGREETPPN